MEFQPITPPPTLFPPGSEPQRKPVNKKKILLLAGGAVVVIGFVLVALSVGASRNGGKSSPLSIIKDIPFLKDIATFESGDFFRSSVPKPIDTLALTDLPSLRNVSNVVKNGNRMWVASDGHIIEYDTTQNEIELYSDPQKTGICTDIAFAANKLYAACNVRGIKEYEDAYKGVTSDEHFAIFRINPETRAIERVFTFKDGLKNTTTYKLTPDTDGVWVSTGDGFANISAGTGTVRFFDKQLGIPGTRFATDVVLVDGDSIWVEVLPNDDSKGGIALFNKKTNTWKPFGPDELQDREKDKIDIEALKLVPGGAQIAFRDGRIDVVIRLVEKQYDYTTGVWTKLSDQPTTGDLGTVTYAKLAKDYPQKYRYTITDASGFAQLRYPPTNETFLTNGRRNYVMTPVVAGKRYILTGASVDVLGPSDNFPKLLARLGEEIKLQNALISLGEYQRIVQFAAEPDGRYAIATFSDCDGRGCRGGQKAWFVDLKNGKVLHKYGAVEGLPSGKLLTGLTAKMNNGLFTVYNTIGAAIFTIDTHVYLLNPLIAKPKN